MPPHPHTLLGVWCPTAGAAPGPIIRAGLSGGCSGMSPGALSFRASGKATGDTAVNTLLLSGLSCALALPVASLEAAEFQGHWFPSTCPTRPLCRTSESQAAFHSFSESGFWDSGLPAHPTPFTLHFSLGCPPRLLQASVQMPLPPRSLPGPLPALCCVQT